MQPASSAFERYIRRSPITKVFHTSSLEDNTRICASKDYETAVTACLHAGCTVRQSLAVKKYLTNKCDLPVRNEGSTPRGASWALCAFALFSVIGRFVFRASGSSYGIDDWTALFSIGVLLSINFRST
ncbi:hypothetical protein AC578_774 [Pseudocercospora eumusae]|uniref:CFEM domain-containing protein n=1 Tax=Pseudocercospora eumusae TaxID=321146 RepID=A0A139HMX0_9PEZI|nr:hypothetical protein AC578_774 [Pseudocercospora eumusae]